MMKKLIKCSALLLVAFSIFSLIRNVTNSSSDTSNDTVVTLSSVVRDGDDDSGFVLF